MRLGSRVRHNVLDVGCLICALGFEYETLLFRISRLRSSASFVVMTESPAGNQEPTAESLEVIRKFAETYAQRTGTYFCSDPGVTSVVLKGLARHKDDLGGARVPAATTKTRKPKCPRPSGTVLVCQCVSARSATACCS